MNGSGKRKEVRLARLLPAAAVLVAGACGCGSDFEVVVVVVVEFVAAEAVSGFAVFVIEFECVADELDVAGDVDVRLLIRAELRIVAVLASGFEGGTERVAFDACDSVGGRWAELVDAEVRSVDGDEDGFDWFCLRRVGDDEARAGLSANEVIRGERVEIVGRVVVRGLFCRRRLSGVHTCCSRSIR